MKSRALRFAWILPLIAAPYLWMIFTAFRPRLDITASPPDLTTNLTFANFSWTYNGQDLLRLLGNSLFIATLTAAVTILIGAPAAYYFARNRSLRNERLFLLVLSTRMAPPIALSLPMFLLFVKSGLYGTYLSVVIANSVFNVGFVVWFLEGIIAGIPVHLERAAQADGSTRLGALIDVVVPSIGSTIAMTAGFVFLFSWNEYLMASLLTTSSTRPITPALPGFVAQATSQWGAFCAVALVSSLPALCIAFTNRRFLADAFLVRTARDRIGELG